MQIIKYLFQFHNLNQLQESEELILSPVLLGHRLATERPLTSINQFYSVAKHLVITVNVALGVSDTIT
jgi:ABC-type thiamine transport system ATPase subunit